MTRDLTHDEAAASLEAAALGALSAEEERAVVAHAATCPECGPALVGLRNAASTLSLAAPDVSMDPERKSALRARLLNKAASKKEVSIIAPLVATTPQRFNPRGPGEAPFLTWYSVAATIIAVASVGLLVFVMRDRSHLQTMNEMQATNQSVLSARLDSVSQALNEQESIVRAIAGSRVRVYNLTAAGTRQQTARMFWDQGANRWTMFAHFLPTPRQGRAYQLWLISRGARISAGTFQPNASGDATVRAEIQLGADALDGIAVTDEPAGGVNQPTGQVIMAATVK